jgi:hypothetical protein
MSGHGVYFIGIARVNDGVILARWVHSKEAAQKNEYITTVSNLTTNKSFASRAVPNKRFCLLSPGFSVNFIADDDRFAFVVLTEKSYPERVVFKLIAELQREFAEFRSDAQVAGENKLSKKLYDVFDDLGSRYDDPSKIDKVTKAKQSVDKASQQLQKNIDDLENLHMDTSALATTANELRDEAHTLKETSAEYHKRMKCRKYKITAAIVGAVVGALCIIIIPMVIKFAVRRRRRMLRGFDDSDALLLGGGGDLDWFDAVAQQDGSSSSSLMMLLHGAVALPQDGSAPQLFLADNSVESDFGFLPAAGPPFF